MFRIRRIHDDVMPVNRQAIHACCDILLAQIPTATERERSRILDCLRDPIASRYKSVLLVAEGRAGVLGFCLLMHLPSLRFSYLDYICTAPGRTSGGIGSSLYGRCREEAQALGAAGLFFEVHVDDPARCADADALAQNRARLKFYERWGARPVVGTAWDGGCAERAPLRGDAGLGSEWDAANPTTYLCYDELGANSTPPRDDARAMIRAILELRYGDEVPRGNVEAVVESLVDERLRQRPFRYVKPGAQPSTPVAPLLGPIPMVLASGHEQHWVHDRGYYEAPARIAAIASVLEPSGLVHSVSAKHWPDRHVAAVHRADYMRFLTAVAKKTGDRSLYPDVFPPRGRDRWPQDPLLRAGWFCIDTFTPLNGAAIAAARHAVDCALTAADLVLQGEHCAYSLARPPGHHAEPDLFGGYCYYNNTAIAAQFLVERLGRVAILDIDYHHGNGQQQIFLARPDVLTVSIHGDPQHAYPFYAGYADEHGEGAGAGCNLNLPLPIGCDGAAWRKRGLEPALACIRAFAPSALVIACGLDTAKADPTGSFVLEPADFHENGRMIGELRLPTLVVQEGGYRTATLGTMARAFLRGLAVGADLIAADHEPSRAPVPREARPRKRHDGGG